MLTMSDQGWNPSLDVLPIGDGYRPKADFRPDISSGRYAAEAAIYLYIVKDIDVAIGLS